MAQANINIRTDADLKQDFERLCHDVGINMTTAFNMIMKQSVRENKIPVSLTGDPFYSEENVARIRRAADRLDAGYGVKVTMEELEALEKEEPGGPTFQGIEQRRKQNAVNDHG